jgi:Rieske Fe-S protein
MERREFIEKTCLACLVPGIGGLSALLSSCASGPVYRAEMIEHQIRVPESLFAMESVQVIRAADFADDIALVRMGERDYHAFVLRCTHADNPLSYRGTEFTCSLHGSRFDTGGRVTHGPAALPLQQLKTSLYRGVITIFT